MNKKTKIAIVAAAALVAGGVGVYLYRKAERRKRALRTVVTPEEARTIIAEVTKS